MPKPFFESLPILTESNSYNPKCDLCKLYKGCNSPKMKVSGKGKKEILVISEAPGREEDEQGIQLVGNSGRELVKIFSQVGIDMRRDCWLENALMCHPPKSKIPDDRMVNWCRPHVNQTVDELKPRVVLLLGKSAIKSYLQKYWKEDTDFGPMRWAGYCIPLQETNTWVIPTFHPSFLLRENNPVLNMMFVEALRKVARLQGRPYEKEIPNYPSSVQLFTDDSRAVPEIKKFNQLGELAFDYETNCLKPEGNRSSIYSCSLSNGVRTIAFLWGEHSERACKSILSRRDIRKIASNAKFEDRWTRAKLGIEVQGWTLDTMLTSHLLENNKKERKITSIKFQAFVHLGVPSWDTIVKPYLHASKKDGCYALNRVKEAPVHDLLRYNGLDSLYEFLIYHKQKQTLQKGFDEISNS